ncbi:Ig-like domain-containing protein, partial [Enterococcus quebecensis]
MKKYKIINIILVVVTVLSILTSGVPAMAQGKVNRAAGTATISAILFEDLNSDGKQDPNESGIEGITMRLLDDSGTEIKKTVTDKAGRYTFDELASGMYQLKIDYPLGYVKVTSGPLPFSSEGFSSHFDLDDDETYTGGWIGFNSTDPSITGTVFNDENKSGIKDTSEKGIAGIDLGLYLIGSSTLVQTTKSDANGNYSFTKITPDKSYEVKALSIPSKYEVIENNNFDKNGKSIQFDLKTQDKKTNVNLALYENIPVTDISVEPKELIQFVGDTGKLKVTITPNNATDKEVTYASLDPSVMTVDQDGNWEAKAVGNTIITVTTKNGKTAYVRVTVKEILADGISVEPKILDQYVGDTGKLKVTITPDNTTNKNVSYMSVDPSILTIDQEGNWVAKSPGNTMVLVTTSNGKMAVVQVIVREKPVLPDKIVVEPKVLDQFVGDTGKLKVTYQPSNTNVKDATFTSVNPEIMTVDQEGNWEAKSPGVTVIIVLTSNNKMATVSVTVREKDIPVEKVKVEPSILDQYVGDTGTLNVTITPANATNKNVTFTSANPEIMTVDASGNWVAKAVGRTEITVTASNGVTGTVQVIVREREIPVEDIKVEPSILDQYVGDTGTLNVTITPANATNKNVTFSSLNPEIMTVDASGNWV